MPTGDPEGDSLKEWVFVVDIGTFIRELTIPIDFENSEWAFDNAIKRKREILFDVSVSITPFVNPNSFDVVYFQV